MELGLRGPKETSCLHKTGSQRPQSSLQDPDWGPLKGLAQLQPPGPRSARSPAPSRPVPLCSSLPQAPHSFPWVPPTPGESPHSTRLLPCHLLQPVPSSTLTPNLAPPRPSSPKPPHPCPGPISPARSTILQLGSLGTHCPGVGRGGAGNHLSIPPSPHWAHQGRMSEYRGQEGSETVPHVSPALVPLPQHPRINPLPHWLQLPSPPGWARMTLGESPHLAVPQFLQPLHIRNAVQAERAAAASVLHTVSPASALTVSVLLTAPSTAQQSLVL